MEDREKKEAENQYPDGGYGWVIVGAICLINVSLLTLVPCFGLIFKDEFKQWGVSSAQTSFLLHLQNSLFCLFGFFSSPCLKIYGMRRVSLVGAFLMSFGIFLTSFATSYAYLVFSTSVLIGIGQGIAMPATYLATYTYFKKRLTIALSLTVTSASLSSIILPKICDKLLAQIGRKYVVLVLFAISLLSFIGCGLLKPVKKKKIMTDMKPEVTKELLPNNSNKVYQSTTTAKPQNVSVLTKIFNIFDLHLLKDVPLVIMIIGLGVSFASELNIILMLQFILEKLSLFERSDIATAVMIQSIADIIGRLLIPMLAHCANASGKVMYAGALILASCGRTILAIWPTNNLVVFGVIFLIGLTKGTRAVFQSVILPKYVSLDKIPAATGVNMLFTGFVSLIIGPLLGIVHDKTGSYIYALQTASVLSVSCVVMWILEWAFLERATSSEE
ncbi:unnamed protein product [Ceutorhynchus assimilis]|uniref:Uncharacterized protein n=1 Tax=Ceutorhynchus assimilis TaxID=467358 RepID=A0A9N9MCE0_9CUCU|nr:unnamed protein product [Ceutorhynchus assimilis]